MKKTFTQSSIILLLAACLAPGQVLYNQARDDAAQKALNLGKGIASGDLFAKQLDNLDRMNKYSMDRIFGGAELQMRANLLRFSTWSNVQRLVDDVATRISGSQAAINGAQFKAKKAEAQKAIETAKAQAAELKKAPVAGSDAQKILQDFGSRLDQASNLDDALHFIEGLPSVGDLEKLPAAYGNAVDEVSKLATSLGELFKNFKITLPTNPTAMAIQTHLALLDAEVAHLNALGAIATRRDSEIADTLTLIDEARNELNSIRTKASSDDIQASLTKGVADAKADPTKRNDLRIMMHALFNAAAISARDETPLRLATLRAASEERAYSIRESAIASQGYEQTLLAGLQRLSVYYKGGIKPQTLGQFLNTLATLGLIPTVLTR